MPLREPYPEVAILDLLVTVAERGSISEAAAIHGVSQPAASMRLKTLETVLGLQLLERTPAGSKLTDAGEATVGWAGAVLHAMRSLLSGASVLRTSLVAELRLGASMTVAEYLVPTWLHRLANAASDLKVSLKMGNSAQVTALVGADQVDLGFVEGPGGYREFNSRTVMRDQLAVVVGASHPWSRRKRPLSARELATTPLLIREPGSGTRDVLDQALEQHGLAPIAYMEFGSTTAIKSAAISGAAPAVLSILALKDELRTGELVLVPCNEIRLDRMIWAIWERSRKLSAGAARLLAVARSNETLGLSEAVRLAN